MKNKPKPLLVLVLMLGLISGCGQADTQNENISPLLPEPTAASVSTDCKKIAFIMSSGSIPDVYTTYPDGSELTNLTNDPAPDSHPSWSPDGTKIAFASSRDGSNQIYIMDIDGSNSRKLTSNYENDFPIWLPDGKQVAIRTTDGNGLWWWRVVDIETNGVSEFSEPSYDFFFQTPAWSPDGQFIAYMSLVEQQPRNDGSSQIHIRSVNGSSDIPLTNDVWANINPMWSPDSKKVAFLSERDGKYNMFALYVMSQDGTNLQKLTEPIYSENVTFSWSPDGNQIVISSDAAVGNIQIIDVSTGSSKELVDVPDGGWASAPSWQP